MRERNTNFNSYVIDTYAWVEYFRGTEEGEKVKSVIEENKGITPTIVIAELKNKYGREGWDFAKPLSFLETKTAIVVLNKQIALLAGEINLERKRKNKRWSLEDSIILATARVLNAKVITGDEHFRDLKEEVTMIK